ncbi:large ribosomal subunit protein uL22m-like [Halichondria panicea]|uniref:large ribosomal subunit protein uL22m-like n=1 Tax=Halichondria panicea TaxID=6063 RepID=UPI00312B7E60
MWSWKPTTVILPRLLQLTGLGPCVAGSHRALSCCYSTIAQVQREASTPSAPQPRDFHGCMQMIKTSPMKLNLVAKLIRRLPIGQALAQVEFCEKKVAEHVKMVLTDTQRKSVIRHKVAPLNLWVAESFVGKGQYKKSIRYHGKGMFGNSHKMYAHYFLTLREGRPPRKVRSLDDHSKWKTKKLIQAGPRTIPNAL